MLFSQLEQFTFAQLETYTFLQLERRIIAIFDRVQADITIKPIKDI